MIEPSLLARFAGRTLAIAPERLNGLLALRLTADDAPQALPAMRVTDDGVAVLPVIGPLVARHDWLSRLLGATSYPDLVALVRAALDDQAVRAVLLEVDSPGGEVAGLFDAVSAIRAAAREADKPLWAIACEAALSAAYAIASAAERVLVTRTAEVGSIGVVRLHVDQSRADQAAGLAYEFIVAGARKLDGNPHRPLADATRERLQADVDRVHDELVALIATNRGLSSDAVRGTEAAVYRGTLARNVGFADAIATLDAAIAELGAAAAAPSGRAPIQTIPRRRIMTETSQPPGATTDSPQEVPATPSSATAGATTPIITASQPAVAPATAVTLPSPTSPASPPMPTDPAAALRAEVAELAAIAAQAARLGIAIDVAEAVKTGTKPEALRRSVLDELAAKAEASAIIGAVPTTATGESPIVKRARERAAQARDARGS